MYATVSPCMLLGQFLPLRTANFFVRPFRGDEESLLLKMAYDSSLRGGWALTPSTHPVDELRARLIAQRFPNLADLGVVTLKEDSAPAGYMTLRQRRDDVQVVPGIETPIVEFALYLYPQYRNQFSWNEIVAETILSVSTGSLQTTALHARTKPQAAGAPANDEAVLLAGSGFRRFEQPDSEGNFWWQIATPAAEQPLF